MGFVGFSDRIESALEDRGLGVFTVEVKPLSDFARKRLLERLERVRLGYKKLLEGM